MRQASLCVKELERLKGSKSPSSIQKQPTNLVAAVELVLTRQAQSRNNNNNSHKCTAERLSVLDQQDVAPDIVRPTLHIDSLLIFHVDQSLDTTSLVSFNRVSRDTEYVL